MRAAYLDLDGTLLGPGGSVLRDAAGDFSMAGIDALGLLHAAGVRVVLASGRSRPRLEAVRATLGADGILPEMGACDCGYPTEPGQSVHAAISATGVPQALLAAEPQLAVHPLAQWGREGSHVFIGRVSPDAAALVGRLSEGTLRLADNGQVEPGAHIFHLLPTAASKAAAVARDVEANGVDADASLAVGDSHQDLGMGQVVGRVAIVANGAAADASLAREAPWVTRAPFAAGVLEAVRAWL